MILKIRMMSTQPSDNNAGNKQLQSHLVSALQRDIHRYRQTLRNSLESQLLFDVKKHRTVDDHFSRKKREITQTANHVKSALGSKKPYFETRGKLIIDRAYDKMVIQLRELQLELERELKSYKEDEVRMAEDVKQFEHRMAIQRRSGHFFKSLYESDPAKPVGETLEMLREDGQEELRIPSLWELAFAFVAKIMSM